MGSGRPFARSYSARPPPSDPVNPAAVMAGCWTSLRPASVPCSTANVPSGAPASASAARTTWPVRTDRPGWPECALTTTGQPAASALAVSPPATENANGKLLAENTATGPSGSSIRRRSGRGAGRAFGSGRSTTASRNEPSSTTSANISSCTRVRVSSPPRRTAPRPVSESASATSSSRCASMAAAAASRIPARCVNGRAANAGAAPCAARANRSTSSSVACGTRGPAGSPVYGFQPWSAPVLMTRLLRGRRRLRTYAAIGCSAKACVPPAGKVLPHPLPRRGSRIDIGANVCGFWAAPAD